MAKLQCDLCGGSIIMQGGGQLAVCDSCGMQYSVERMREKVQEITGTVRIEGPVQARQTGTEDDVAQWKSLLDKYYKAGDFQAAENVVKKILEAVPSDEQANKMYDELQVLKFMEIKNGVLISYNGQAESLIIPSCVEKIEDEAFKENQRLEEVTIPSGVNEIGRSAFEGCVNLKSIFIPDSVQKIGDRAFCRCSSLFSAEIPAHITSIGNSTFESCGFSFITIPVCVASIGNRAFCFCRSLSSITIPPNVTSIGYEAFFGCDSLSSITIPPSVTFIGNEAFASCNSLSSITIPPSVTSIGNKLFVRCPSLTQVDGPEVLFISSQFDDYNDGPISPWYMKKSRRQMKVCQYCGGHFGGLFTLKCMGCGKPKDY